MVEKSTGYLLPGSVFYGIAILLYGVTEGKEVVIRAICAEETIPLRHKILRPHQEFRDCIYPGDDEAQTLHLGAFLKEELIGIATLYNQNQAEKFEEGIWRLRGMAVLEEHRSLGVGTKLMEQILEHVQVKKAKRLWCNARSTAVGFYAKFLMKPEGKEFLLPSIGPHYVFSRLF